MKIKSLWLEKLNDPEIQDLMKIKFSSVLTYHIKRVAMNLRQQSQAYYEQKNEIIEKYKTDGKIPDEHLLVVTMKIAKLCDVDIDINIDPYEVRLEDLPEISVIQFEFIEPFLTIRT